MIDWFEVARLTELYKDLKPTEEQARMLRRTFGELQAPQDRAVNSVEVTPPPTRVA
jgi:hypothetical protein